MKATSRSITSFYALIQSLFWMTYGLMFNFASAYLLDRGFSNGQIGAILGVAYALSACAQPLIAGIFNRRGIRLSSGMACVCMVVAALAALVLFLPLERGALAALIVCAFMLQSSLQPTVNSLYRGYALSGVPVNFSLARGVGSAAYSVMCALVGRLLRRLAPSVLPALYLATELLLIACLLLFRAPSFTGAVRRGQQGEQEPLLRRHPSFALFLLGLICLAMVHIFIDNFMLQIMQNLGGGSAQQGVAIAVAAVTELPAMVFYSWLHRRVDCGKLLCMAAWVWVAKDLLTALAASPAAIYASELLQFASYAFYVPAAVDYISAVLPQEDFLKGQALAGTAFTLGSLAATFIGGSMLDALGASRALCVMQVFSVAGAVLFTVAIPRASRVRQCS